MGLDIYLRIPSDPYYDDTQLEIDDDVYNFVQGIEMILTTNKGEIFGSPDFGASLESYLWNPNISASTIKSEINRQIFQFCQEGANRIPYSVEVNFMKGDITDSILVDIVIDNQKVLGIAATPVNKNQNYR
jgi:hypothetical protein